MLERMVVEEQSRAEWRASKCSRMSFQRARQFVSEQFT
jgi:hypothetical protein